MPDFPLHCGGDIVHSEKPTEFVSGTFKNVVITKIYSWPDSQSDYRFFDFYLAKNCMHSDSLFLQKNLQGIVDPLTEALL